MQEEEVIFIQIGSNEGVMRSDPLCSLILKNRWKGVLIEPVPRIFEKLKKNYEGHPQLHFENVAISDTRKTCDFYVIDETFKPHLKNKAGELWGDRVSSLEKKHLFKLKEGLTEEKVNTIQVQCVTLQDIVDKYELDHVDVLHMDTEGHDAIILKSIDFNKIKPKVIVFEHIHITLDVYLSCLGHLSSHGYSVLYANSIDTVVGI